MILVGRVYFVFFFNNEKLGVISDTLSNSLFLSASNRGHSQWMYERSCADIRVINTCINPCGFQHGRRLGDGSDRDEV